MKKSLKPTNTKKKQTSSPSYSNAEHNESLEGLIRDDDDEYLLETREHKMRAHSGPLPSPDILSQYDNIIPDGAERIMKMAELEQANRHKIQNDSINRQINLHRNGQIIAFVSLILMLFVTCFAIYFDKDGVAYVFGSVTIVGVVVAIIRSTSKSNSDDDLED